MTTYSYTLVLSDSEMITLEAALRMLATHCDQELKAGGGAPYFAWQHNIKEIQARLHAHARQTSGGGIDPKTGKYSIWVDLSGRPPKDDSKC
jgi:hypothetical protein